MIARLWTILRAVLAQISEDRVLLVAAGITFYLLLALFPALSAFVLLYGMMFDPSSIPGHLSLVAGLLPDVALDILGRRLEALAAAPRDQLGLGLAATLLLALWSANGGVKALMEGLNIAYDREESRSFLRRNLVALAFTLGVMAVIVLMILLLGLVPVALAVIPLGVAGEVAVTLLRWPLLLVVMAVGIALLYRYGPCRPPPDWRWVTWGSAFAALGWVAGSLAFAFYAEGLADFEGSYGAMAAPIAFLLWVWLVTVILLVGAEIDAELARAKGDRAPGTTGGDLPGPATAR